MPGCGPNAIKAQQTFIKQYERLPAVRHRRYASDGKTRGDTHKFGIRPANAADKRRYLVFIGAPIACGNDQQRLLAACVFVPEYQAFGNLAQIHTQCLSGFLRSPGRIVQYHWGMCMPGRR